MNITVTLTQSEARALILALGNGHGDEQDRAAVYGSRAQAAAADRAERKIRKAAWQAERKKITESPNVQAARELRRREVYGDKFDQAKRNGFSDADARLHAEQALALHDKETAK